MALLNLLYVSLFANNSGSGRKMFFKVHILYIEESSAVYGITPEQRAQNISFITKACDTYGFTYTIVPLE
jgi:hypothetical protein